MRRLFTLAAGVFALAVASSPALALSARTFVLGTGTTDSGVCTLTAPCRTFAYALTQTAPSGEIAVLGSGGYGTVTIDKSVSIINTSNFAGVTVASGNGITIATGTSESVTLRGLTIDGGGTGSNGIVVNSGGTTTIDQCNVMNFVGSSTSGNGILVQPISGNHTVVITNTTASNNGYSGISYLPQSNGANTGLVFDHVSANGNQYGIAIDNSASSGAAMASISNGIASANTAAGFYFSNATASLDLSYAASNLSGVTIVSGTLALGRSVIMNNSNFGINVIGGTFNDYSDNRIAGNTILQINGAANVVSPN